MTERPGWTRTANRKEYGLKLSIEIDDALYRAAQAAAKGDGRSLAEYVRRAIALAIEAGDDLVLYRRGLVPICRDGESQWILVEQVGGYIAEGWQLRGRIAALVSEPVTGDPKAPAARTR